MATKEAKSAKKSKENEKKKSTGKFDKDEPITAPIADENTNNSEIMETATDEVVEAMESSIQGEEVQPVNIYYEPPLSDMIVANFEGEKVHGLYEGDGNITFEGGNEYQGELSEGLMHGRGKYTWNSGLIYDGDFTRNVITGKGTYIWPDGSTYTGEVENGKRHGFGSFKCKFQLLTYTGVWQQGRRHGKGRLDFTTGGDSYYDGEWNYDVREGLGTRQYPSGNVYVGDWKNNQRHGVGMMKWFDCDQIYEGSWDSGIQHGWGQHVWLLRRMSSSQYPLRNMYIGEFHRGLRQGFGTFIYSSGARYEGEWSKNIKDGQGKFIFKNGRVFEGVFHKDRIIEYPDFMADGTSSPDPSQIRTRTPLPSELMETSSNTSNNTISPSFQLDINHLLTKMAGRDCEEESRHVMFVILQHMSTLRHIYTYYSCLGTEDHESPDNTYIMKRIQFWRLLKDCRLHHFGITLSEMDRWLGRDDTPLNELHDPNEKILQRQFVNMLITLAYRIHEQDFGSEDYILASCFTKLLDESILPYGCKVKGYFYFEMRRALNALVHHDQAYFVFTQLCTPRKYAPHELSLKMRDFLYVLKDCSLLTPDLTPHSIINILSSDDPNAGDGDGCCNLELEMTFLEFLEALVGCAQVYVTEDVMNHHSTPAILTPDGIISAVSEVGDEGVENEERDSKGMKQSPSGHTNTQSEDQASTQGSEKPPTNSETRLGKISSFVSSHGDRDSDMIPSDASIADKEGSCVSEELDEELDETTRAYNFWTHQVHIFFSQKFFPAAEKLLNIRTTIASKMAETKSTDDNAEHLASEKPSINLKVSDNEIINMNEATPLQEGSGDTVTNTP